MCEGSLEEVRELAFEWMECYNYERLSLFHNLAVSS